MRRLAIILAVAGVLCALNSALADDLNPPPQWSRTDPRTTFQKWEFGSDLDPYPAEDGYVNPFGRPAVDAVGTYPLNKWSETYEGASGVRRSDQGWLQIEIGNFYEQLPLKDIWLQVTYWADNHIAPDVSTLPGGTVTKALNYQIGQTAWWYAAYSIQIKPNPESETIYIMPSGCTVFIDQIVIDTICTVPEPTTMGLLGLGALALLRKRRQ